MSRAFMKEHDDAPEPEARPQRRVIGEIPPPPQDRSTVGMGATVLVEGTGPQPRAFTIVPPDQSDVPHDRIGIDSPLAQALLGSRAGADVVWHRPVGDRTLRVISVRYD